MTLHIIVGNAVKYTQGLHSCSGRFVLSHPSAALTEGQKQFCMKCAIYSAKQISPKLDLLSGDVLFHLAFALALKCKHITLFSSLCSRIVVIN